LDQASQAFDAALRLDPFDPELTRAAWFGKSWICEILGRYEEGVVWANKIVAQEPRDLSGLSLLEANLFHAGHTVEAKAVLARMRATFPDMGTKHWRTAWSRSGPYTALMARNIEGWDFPE